MKLKKIVSHFVTGVLIVLFLIVALSTVMSKASGGAPELLGYQIKIVLSGSMEPGIKTGSIVAIKPGGDMNRFAKGDVITFKNSEDMIVTHRIFDVAEQDGQKLYTTKGDNNQTPDTTPIPSSRIIGKYTGFTIPYVGYGMNFADSKKGSLLLLLVPGLLLLIYSVVTTWKAISELEQKKSQPAAPAAPSNPDALS
ncbi:signal peptidase I [Paenibacillus rhizovicinus]|uniref:Signal peptidase I n=1 Tax=Paenibacillus rhizovicinus TaxID=2704463 RepID=A0A6C0NZ68_9BACL|nr:signal peptidase I [Paenibacillus rhizovicinus]QHW31517.1 signal peptidase I [Paenibacillus rhizovicinus]